MSIAYYNGVFSKPEDVRIPLSDRSVFFGDGVYDAAIGRHGKIYMLDEHVERFFANAKAMKIHVKTEKSEMRDLLYECVKRSGEDSFFLYFQASRRGGERKHACTAEKSNLLITVTRIDEPTPDSTMTLSIFEDKRYLYCNVKTLNLLPSVLASCDAEIRGFDEAIFHREGTVTECAHSNVSIIKDGELFTHPEGAYILSGTARAKMISTALDMGIVCHDTPFSVRELMSADEVLVTSSTKLCRRARRIEEKVFPLSDDTIGAKICKAIHRDYVISTE